MVDILFTAKGAEACAVVSGKLTSGMVGVPVRFCFDSEWERLNVIAVFEGGGHTISVPLLGETKTTVPWEVLQTANTRLRIGAEGRSEDGTCVIPTVWANAAYIAEGANATDDLGKEPTPTPFDIIMAAIGDLTLLPTQQKDSLVSAIRELYEVGGSGSSGLFATQAWVLEQIKAAINDTWEGSY